MMPATGAVSRRKSNGQLLEDRLADRVVRPDEHHGVAVGRRIDHRLGADIAAGAGAVLDHELLAEMVRQPVAQNAGDDVVRAAGREAHDQVHGPFGILGLRRRRCRQGSAEPSSGDAQRRRSRIKVSSMGDGARFVSDVISNCLFRRRTLVGAYTVVRRQATSA